TDSLVKVNLIGLHLWLLFGGVWIPSVDLKLLHSLLLLLWNALSRGNRGQISNTSSNSTKSTNGSNAHHRRLSEALLGDEGKRHLEMYCAKSRRSQVFGRGKECCRLFKVRYATEAWQLGESFGG